VPNNAGVMKMRKNIGKALKDLSLVENEERDKAPWQVLCKLSQFIKTSSDFSRVSRECLAMHEISTGF